MTKKELMKVANYMYNYELCNSKPAVRVYNCKACIISWDNKDFSLLKSYTTIVGIYSHRTSTMYVFDYYSATTYKHIYKACRMLGAMRITWLYKKSDNVIETPLSNWACRIKCTDMEFKAIEVLDYSTYIEDRTFT